MTAENPPPPAPGLPVPPASFNEAAADDRGKPAGTSTHQPEPIRLQ